MRSDTFRGADDFARSVEPGRGFHAASACGSLFVIQSQFGAYDGAVHATPFLRVGLLVGGGGAYSQRTAAGTLEADWRPGELVVIPPFLAGEGRCAPVDMIGFGIDLAHRGSTRISLPADRLAALAASLHRDEALGAVLLALRHAAELQGCSRLFFEQGAELVLDRVAALAGLAAPRKRARLDGANLRRVFEFVEARLGADLSVAEMAAVANYESSGFTRAFKHATGLSPFCYLTRKRLERAAHLIERGEPITSVSAMVGYANASKFAAAFRRQVGMSPRAWARTQGHRSTVLR